MTLLHAINVCKEMQMWRRSEGKYDGGVPVGIPYTPKEYGEALDVLIHLAERQLEMEQDMERFVANLVRTSKG